MACDECGGDDDVQCVGGALWCAECLARFEAMPPLTNRDYANLEWAREEFDEDHWAREEADESLHAARVTGVLVPTGRVQVCCSRHTPGGLGWCCKITDCSPCCPECPTCVVTMSYESANPGWRKQAAADRRRWQAERNTDRRALAHIAAAMWWFDRFDWTRTVIHPQVPMLVRTSRAVARTTWAQVF